MKLIVYKEYLLLSASGKLISTQNCIICKQVSKENTVLKDLENQNKKICSARGKVLVINEIEPCKEMKLFLAFVVPQLQFIKM